MKNLIVVLIGGFIAFAGYSQDRPKPEFNLVGITQASYRWNDPSLQKWEWILKPEVRFDFSKKIRFYVKGRFYADVTDNLEMGRSRVDEASRFSRRHLIGDRSEWELRETYLDLDLDNLGFLRVGKQQIVWGETDGLKLLDVVNPQNFREFILADFDESRIPLWSVKHDFMVDELNVQLVWIPDNSYHDLPELDHPFFPKSNLPELGNSQAMFNPVNKQTRFFKDSEFGVKLNQFKNGWDVSLNYLYTFDDFAIFGIQSSADPGFDLAVTPYYSRYHVIGGSFNKAVNSISLRGEVAANINREFGTLDSFDFPSNVTKNQLSSAIGVDWLPGENMFSAQVFVDKVFNVKTLFGRDPFDSFLTFLYRRDLFNDSMTLEFQEIHNLKRGDGLARVSANYFLLSNLELTAGTDLFYGDENELFGQFTKQNRMSLGLKWGI